MMGSSEERDGRFAKARFTSRRTLEVLLAVSLLTIRRISTSPASTASPTRRHRVYHHSNVEVSGCTVVMIKGSDSPHQAQHDWRRRQQLLGTICRVSIHAARPLSIHTYIYMHTSRARGTVKRRYLGGAALGFQKESTLYLVLRLIKCNRTCRFGCDPRYLHHLN